ncbi:MAG TPA: bifunctional diaminohydroxyphosphoribosylaminopyrimidine deaminase/5-amino-6-(5-phosphoribosylamino)uracil reductase RibD [Syntrophomonadaceae bacterium]|nr:bifunctional diaminohydroxyphosphoribosylaminopyrimidine deaminase/5-amino-6-(5-phosphoribosylamino)uracil reductase RibD [Syntrophomonadaceae bacterium]
MDKQNDLQYMNLALELASRARGRTSPNPIVGAVIVKDQDIIGRGYHKRAGMPHAEVEALREAGHLAQGATLYVSLEPCCHQGRTPPCTRAVIEAGIKRVVIATLDPNPLVAGKGMTTLQQAGITSEVGLLQDEAKRLNEFFFKYIQEQRPFVTLKVAMTLDGRIASHKGDSRWITSPVAREYVHHLRNAYDAIMVGIGTVLADDPQLNTRLDMEDRRDPVRVIIDGELDLPLKSRIAQSSHQQPSLLFCNKVKRDSQAQALQELGVEIIELGGEGSMVPLEPVLHELGRRGFCSLLLEGGAELNASMLGRRLVDKVHWMVAPKIIGGRTAPGPVGGPGLDLMEQALELKDVEYERLGPDVLFTAYTGW